MTEENKNPKSGEEEEELKEGMPVEALNRIAKADRRRREKAERLLKEREAELEQLRAKALTDDEKKAKELRDQILAEAEAKYAPELKKANTLRLVERILYNKNADLDSWKFLDLSKIETEEDAETVVAELLASKPHLVFAAKEPVPFQPGAPGRPRPAKGVEGGPQFITHAQVKAWTADPKMYAEKKDLIAAASREGRIVAE